MSQRIRKVNEMIREEVSLAISENLSKGDFVTVKAVEASRDLKNATVWVSILGDEKTAYDNLMLKARDIERLVRSKMYSKYTPKLEFRIDKSEEYVDNINQLLSE